MWCKLQLQGQINNCLQKHSKILILLEKFSNIIFFQHNIELLQTCFEVYVKNCTTLSFSFVAQIAMSKSN